MILSMKILIISRKYHFKSLNWFLSSYNFCSSWFFVILIINLFLGGRSSVKTIGHKFIPACKKHVNINSIKSQRHFLFSYWSINRKICRLIVYLKVYSILLILSTQLNRFQSKFSSVCTEHSQGAQKGFLCIWDSDRRT